MNFVQKNLNEMINDSTFSKIDIVFIIYQIVEGMKFIHFFKKIIHRDLKPSNILLGLDNLIKNCDFGMSKLMSIENQSMTNGVGTQKFMASEILNEKEYDEKVDVYSFGVVIFFILSGGKMMWEFVKKHPIPKTLNDVSCKLINDCWCFDSKNRPSFDDISKYLEVNNFDLLNLSKSEIDEVISKIKAHKPKIPKYL